MAKVNLVPIRVKIKHGAVGGGIKHIYPDFNLIAPSIRRGGMDWSIYFDFYGIGWHYDHLSGIGESDAYNPDPDIWFGCTCVPEDFAIAAATLFPNDVEIIDEATFETFYNERAHIHEPAQFHDAEILEGIKARRDLGITDTPEILKALDPNDPTSGIRNNPVRFWEGCKLKTGLTIHVDQQKK